MPGAVPGLEVRDEQHRFPALLKLTPWPERPTFLTDSQVSSLHISEISLRHKSEGLKTFYAKGENEAISFIFYLFSCGKSHVI